MKKAFVIDILCVALFLSACAPATQAAVDVSAINTQVAATVFAGAIQTAQVTPATETPTLPPTEIPTATPDPNRTPPALPGVYTTTLLNPSDAPHTYISDACQYLKMKWDSNNAAPGTTVMVIMFHSIPLEPTKDNEITEKNFRGLMKDLKEMGFEAIDTQQMSDFVYKNAKIPQRSVLLIVDDRHYRQYFDQFFYPYYKDWGWKVVNAWINLDDSIGKTVLPENVALEQEGWVDHQSHGVIHNIPMSDQSTDEYLKGELQGSMEIMQANFNKTPTAIIWPGGGFGLRPVQAARQYGFQLGFTINPRGPVLFNWVPQADTSDPMRPSYQPEGSSGDPLLTLPRYWAPDARDHLDTVRKIGKDAAAYAEANKATELEYYDIMCAPALGPIP